MIRNNVNHPMHLKNAYLARELSLCFDGLGEDRLDVIEDVYG